MTRAQMDSGTARATMNGRQVMLISPGEYPYPVKPNGQRDNDALRAWAWAHHMFVAEYGPIPDKVYDQFRAYYADQIEHAASVKVIEL